MKIPPTRRPVRRRILLPLSQWMAGLLAGAFTLVATAQGAPAGGRADARSFDGAALYHDYCSVCHGDRGDGRSRAQGSLNPPPRDFTTPAALQELSRARMLLAVKEGRPGTAMVAWKSQLADPQIEAIVDYVRESLMRASLDASASVGRQVYARSCSVCHGDRGAGSVWASANLRPPPRNFTAPEARTLTREAMIAAVTAGRPGTAMAGFSSQLSSTDIGAVVDYIRGAFLAAGPAPARSGTSAHASLAPIRPDGAAAPGAAPAGAATRGGAADPPAGPAAGGRGGAVADATIPMPHGLVGTAARGKSFYQANCATCHGLKGDGQGPRAYFINPKPRNFLTPDIRAQFSRPVIYAAVSAGRLGSEMPAWDKVLTPQQIADVSEYVFQAFIRAPASVRNAQAPSR